ncbi:MAG: Ig-like domain-containing protein [Thermoplasmata archaeon]|nr:Ig-like domain-containing protein [Thermoplasmata archaeon]
MQTPRGIFNKDKRKFVVYLIVALLCGSVLSVAGTVWGDQASRGPRLSSIIDLDVATAYPHQNLSIFGVNADDQAGNAVATGDLNGDGINDIIIGASLADFLALGRTDCGGVFVIYGSTSLPSIKNLSTQADITIYGANPNDNVGQSVAAGDIDGDGIDDLIIGAPNVDGPLARADCGAVYIINGSTSISANIDLASNPANITIYGQEILDNAGWEVASADVYKDGKDDIIIGALFAKGPNTIRPDCGEVYIINGSISLPTVIDMNTTQGSGPDVTIYGASIGDQAGTAIATGNIGGGAKADLIIGAPFAAGPNDARFGCGEVYVVHGKNNLATVIDLNTTTPDTHGDIIIYGIDPGFLITDNAGTSVAAGDVNGDGNDDIIIGAPTAFGPGNARIGCGEVYIIDNSINLPATIDLNVSAPDIVIYGADIFDTTGIAVEAVDINNDTYFDIVISAPLAVSGPTNNRFSAGKVYVVNGSGSISPTIDLNTTTLSPHHNITIWGAEDDDSIGQALGAGDVDGDSVQDLLIGAPMADGYNNNDQDAGDVYAIFGSSAPPVDLNPWITMTSPLNGTVGVALDANITINFSEPMNTNPGILTWTLNPNVPLTANWITPQIVNLTHTTNFTEKTAYQIKITAGQDLSGKALIQNPNNPLMINPWNFTTGDFTNPNVTLTSPVNASTNVKPEANITITFSEAMNITTVTYTCEPDPGGWIAPPTWDATNTTATFNHTNAFEDQRGYWFNITAGMDLYGLSLDDNPSIPKHIYFVIGDSTPPSIISTTPVTDTTNVALDANMSVTFSEPMKTATVLFTDNAGKNLNWQAGVWSNDNQTVNWSHTTNFDPSTWYNITISAGTDMADNSFISGLVPNPFRFKTTDVVGTAPNIIQTTPADTATNVLLGADVVVKFSLPMDRGTVTYLCTPAVTGGFTAQWNTDNDTLTYTLAANFAKSTNYAFGITAGQDLVGGLDLVAGTIPNPWSFTTVGDNPFILETTPADGATNVLLDADIVIEFSKAMDTTTVQYTCTPTVTGGFTTSWNTAQTEVTFQHAADFVKKTLYTFSITAGKDTDGFDLVPGALPNPLTFETIGDNPIIIQTTPADGDVGVALTADVSIEFNKPMQTGTVMYTTAPTLTGGYTASWNANGDILTLSHVVDFTKDTEYTFEITAGKDLDGNDLVESNPWTFNTVGDEPVIFSTDPAHSELDVKLNQPVVIIFSEAMDKATITYTITSNAGDPGGWVPTWSDSDKTLTYAHNDFTADTKYTFLITAGQDLTADALITGPVPNPFEFTTGAGKIIPDFTTTLSSPADDADVTTLKPTLTWEATENATKYWVYISTSESEVQDFKSSIRKEVTGTSYTPTTALEANMTYYWTVVPNDGVNDGTSSGVRSFTTPAEEAVTPTDKEDEDDFTWLWMLIIIVVIVVIVLAFVMTRKKEEVPPEEPAREEAPPAGPEAAAEPEPEAPVAAPVEEAPPTEEQPPAPAAPEPTAEEAPAAPAVPEPAAEEPAAEPAPEPAADAAAAPPPTTPEPPAEAPAPEPAAPEPAAEQPATAPEPAPAPVAEEPTTTTPAEGQEQPAAETTEPETAEQPKESKPSEKADESTEGETKTE